MSVSGEFLKGVQLIYDDTSADRVYFIGPKAIQNLKDNGVYDEWIAEGMLKFVDLPSKTKS